MKKIDRILSMEDESDAAILLFEWLSQKAGDSGHYDRLNEEEQAVVLVLLFEGEINNGGFDQFFFNSSGDLAHETLLALHRIQAPETATILHEAMEAFPASPIPKDTGARRLLMEDLPSTISEEWDELDERFYEYPENLAELLIAFVQQNKHRFEL